MMEWSFRSKWRLKNKVGTRGQKTKEAKSSNTLYSVPLVFKGVLTLSDAVPENGSGIILSVKVPITIGTMLNLGDDCDLRTCKQTLMLLTRMTLSLVQV